MVSVLVPTVEGLPWEAWAAAVNVAFSSVYTLPSPRDEGSWQSWANELLTVADLAKEGLASPESFGEDWRAWATALLMVTS